MTQKKADTAMHITILAILVTLTLALVGFMYKAGMLSENVNNNTGSIEKIETKVDVISDRTYQTSNKVTKILTILEQAKAEKNNEKSNQTIKLTRREKSNR